jgi:hypothetical protein
MKRLTCLLFIFLVIALACNTAQIGENIAPSGGILYQDNFSDPKSGWGRLDGEAGVAGYSNGAYQIYVKAPNVNLWAHAGMDFSTVRMEVTAMAADGPQENRMGLICRRKDDANFYYFVISADGYFGIGKVRDGKWTLLNGDQMQPNTAIQSGTKINHLRADCIGSSLILYVNDQLVGSVMDADFASGDVGLLAGSFDVPGVDVYFDNFVVLKP